MSVRPTRLPIELIPVEAGELPLSVASAGGTGAAVVIVPSAFGVGGDLEAQMRELAVDASVVVAIDPFFREAPGPLPFGEIAPVLARLGALDRARCHRDLGAAIAWARARAGGRGVVVLGICFGGPFALLAAADGWADAVVTWHGTRMGNFLARAAEMKVPMQLHFGEVDPFVPSAEVEQIRAAFAGRADVEVVVHPGATHGFSHRTAEKAYDPGAERAGMASVRALARAT